MRNLPTAKIGSGIAVLACLIFRVHVHCEIFYKIYLTNNQKEEFVFRSL